MTNTQARIIGYAFIASTGGICMSLNSQAGGYVGLLLLLTGIAGFWFTGAGVK